MDKIAMAILSWIKNTVTSSYKAFYNTFFAGWRHMGGGHYHYFPEKE